MRTTLSPFITVLIIVFLSLPAVATEQVLSPKTFLPYTATIQNTEFEAKIDEPFYILLRLDPETLPPDYMVSTLVDVLKAPDDVKPEVLPGFPNIRLIMKKAGDYELEVRVTLVNKSSCGGINAKEILQKTLSLNVVDL